MLMLRREINRVKERKRQMRVMIFIADKVG
jgi:hypothetical protein